MKKQVITMESFKYYLPNVMKNNNKSYSDILKKQAPKKYVGFELKKKQALIEFELKKTTDCQLKLTNEELKYFKNNMGNIDSVVIKENVLYISGENKYTICKNILYVLLHSN